MNEAGIGEDHVREVQETRSGTGDDKVGREDSEVPAGGRAISSRAASTRMEHLNKGSEEEREEAMWMF